MIRLREFNMAELEYFIDPEATISHDFSLWSGVKLTMIGENEGEVSTSIVELSKEGW